MAATIIAGAWTYLVVSYDSPLGTDNVVVIERTATSNGTSDVLATLSFQDGAEDLDWASTLIEIEINEQSYTCSFGSQSVDWASNAKVNSRLSSDGVTFSTTIDATSIRAGLELGLWKSLGTAANLYGLSLTSASHGAFLIQMTTFIVPVVQGIQGVPIPKRTWGAVAIALTGLFLFT